jgi:hypothetical protein
VRASTDMTEAEVTFETAGGEVVAGLDLVGEAGVDLGGSSTPGSIEAGGGDLSSHDLSGLAGGGPAHPAGSGGDVINGLGSDGRSPSPRPLARALRGAERVGGADPAGRARAVDHLVREREPAARGVAAEFPRAGDDLLGGMLRPAALLALQVGALTLIGEPADAPWPNQFRAMLFWLAGCVLLSLFLSRR